jgi:hypothetical protein
MAPLELTVNNAFAAYRGTYPAREPDLTTRSNDDELRLLSAEEGLRELTIAPIQSPILGIPPSLQSAAGTNKYLWVVAVSAVPIAMEQPQAGVTLSRGCLSHTNLTGGTTAHCGGELWFADDSSVIINGGSGRYPPREAAELQKIATSFKAAGYRTASMGWNDETNRSYRTLRGEPQWI